MSCIMMGVYLPQHFTSELVQRVLLSALYGFFLHMFHNKW